MHGLRGRLGRLTLTFMPSLTEEIETYIARSREARQEINKLTTEMQEVKASESAAKFKAQSLSQELELARNDASWAHSELTRLNSDHTAFRVSKHAELVKLQSELDEASQTASTLQTKVEGLQSAYDDASRRLSEASIEREQLVNRLASQEESFRREVETKDRLNALLQRRTDDETRRREQVESEWENVLEGCRETELELQDKVGQAEDRIQSLRAEKEELQLALDRMAESIGIDTASRAGSIDGQVAPTTPLRPFATSLGLGGNGNTPSIMMMSPTAAMASSMQRSGKTFTEVYTALAKTEEELRREKLETSRLASVLETIMNDLQERGPALQAQREETDRLAVALEELSADFARACEERDSAERTNKQFRAEGSAVRRENDLLNQQLADLGRQVRALTREVIIRDDPSAVSRLQEDGSEFPSLNVAPESDTQSVITTELVTFDSLTSLVAQNGRLLRVARELGARMEEEEAKWRERNEHEESEAVEEATRLIERLESEVGSERSRTEAMRRERDMFRSMLASGSRAGFAASTSSVDGQGPSTSVSGAHATLAGQYTTLQNQFDAFREETSRDADALKTEARQARDEAGKSALAAAREKAGRESSEERYRTLQQTFELQRSELSELSKRLQAQQGNLARLETSSHSLSEDLFSTRKELERLRNESAHLRAERDIAKGSESRLMEEISAMVKEKAGLNELLRNVQSMQNDLDRNANEAKRRMEAQIEKLEEQGKDYRERVQKEEAARREAELRREVDVGGLNSRLERTSAEFAAAKEQLAVAKTNVEHLTRRTEDLQKQIDSKEEKLAVYERRSATSATTNGLTGSASTISTLNNEQQLQIEIAELRGDLRGAQVDAEQSRSHVEQYKAIAQASEEALTQLQATYDEYQTTTQASISEKDGEIAQLRSRLESVAAEITSLQNEASAARQALETQRNEFEAEKHSLQTALTDFNGAEERARADHEEVRADIEKQAQLAREAHQKYETELLAHAEDIKALSALKETLERTRTEARESQKNYEISQADLSTSKVSWEAQREAVAREKDSMSQRINELVEQTTVLHQHLETLTSQVSQIRTADGEPAGDADASFSNAGLESLREIANHHRRDKEIAELHLEGLKQETTRLRLNLEYANRSLEETKVQLAEERERNSAAGSVGAKQHDEVLEKINQLSILRESNATLRDESERSARRAQTLETQLAASQAEIDPLKEQLRTVQNELSAAQGQLRIVQEDNKRWQARAQSILAQYDRIDPEEIKRLEERAVAAETKTQELQQQLEASKTEVTNSKDQFSRLRTQASDRLKLLREEVAGLKEQVETLKREKEGAQAIADQVNAAESEAVTNGLRQQLEAIQEEKQAAEQKATASQQKIQELEQQISELQQAVQAAGEAKTSEANAESGAQADPSSGAEVEAAVAKALEDAQNKWQEEKAALEASKTTIENREKQHHQKAREFLTAMRQAQKERDEIKKEKEAVEANFAANHAEEIEKVVSERVAAGGQQTGGASGNAVAKEEAGLSSDEVEALKRRVAELEEALSKANTRISELEASLQQATASGGASSSQDIEKLKAEHAEALKEQQSTLAQQYQKRQSMAVEVAIKKAQAEAGGAAPNAEAVAQQIQAAVEAKEQEIRQLLANGSEGGAGASDEAALKARYETGFEAGKKEAALRNQLMLKQRDGKIERLTKEIAELKGETPSTPTSATIPTAGSAGAANSAAGSTAATSLTGGAPVGRPAVAQVPGRGGTTVIRGRGGLALASGNGAVRPTPAGQQPSTAAAGAGAGAARGGRGGAVAPRGGLSLRGGATAARGGVAGRGGARGGGVTGTGVAGGQAQKRKMSEDQGAAGEGAKKAKEG
jgi:nucleoprotein TPR